MTDRNLESLIEDFSLLGDWEERYRYLIELGDRLPPMDPALKTAENIVKGCTSKVWLFSKIQNGSFHFEADSDSRIVRGLIYLLTLAYQDRPLETIRAYDIESAFERLGLGQNLSPNRRNGFFAMVGRIRDAAGKER